ncbi:LysE family translocator [Actinokineospora auranticolor]|uniref:Threonine/homoserine/homoserine lactone efflux protein n=1 Tax=Actinokineospora auranticolor TaxID=155976 RepID=A0A2S6GZJ8_9PSEU|nr:LysE family translocator [Actinokineospora auranticolor]PPK70587.1 threonine/homoserine/homoserine lactone efflux protein [Actinokineospora auranticolor]
MTWSGFLAFLLASLILAMVPGVGTAMLLRQSIRGGRRGALATVAGMEVGVAVWAVAAALGLSVLLVASEVAYQGLRVVGVAVLVWFGVKALFGRHEPDEPEVPTSGSGFRAGLLVNLANPKLAVFAISFLPQFVEPGAGRGALITLAALWVVIDTGWYLLIIALLNRVMGWLRRHRVRLERTSGAVLIGLGVKLAVTS